MASAEVLPIVITADDQSAPAFAALKRQVADAEKPLKALRDAFSSLNAGSTSALEQMSKQAAVLRSPYIALAGALGTVALAGFEAYKAFEEYKNLPLKQALEEHKRLIDLIKGSYSDAADAAGKFFREGKNVLELQSTMALKQMLAGLNTEIAKLGRQNILPSVDVMGNITGFDDQAISTKFAPFKEAIDRLNESIGRGAPAIDEYRDAVAEIGKNNPALAETANELLKASQGAADLANNVKDSEAALRMLRGIGTDNDRLRLGLQINKDDPFKKNEFARAVNSITKHIALMEADAAAVGKTSAELEGLRTKAQLEEAARRAGIPIIGKEAKQFDELASRAKLAAEWKARASIQNQIKFDRDSMFLSDTDKQIAQSLRDLYGSDIPAALGSSEAAAMRVNAAMRDFNDIGKEAFEGLADALRDGKLEMSELSGVLDNISRKLMKMAADKLWEQAMGGLLGKGGGGFSLFSLFGMGGGAAPTTTGLDGLPALHHAGGIVGSEPTAFRFVHPAVFDHAPRFHGGGIAGDEIPAVLKRGEGVFTAGQMAALGGGSNSNSVVIHQNVVFNNADPGSEARIRAGLQEMKRQAVKEAVNAVAVKQRNTPGWLS
ncbi:MAG: hypothetical protein EPO23_03245 [Xanthobacteraceae bacterium]|nr:MAG: hypothetical protein EPO23_03245 [Xanthobacteraceae bacterium]